MFEKLQTGEKIHDAPGHNFKLSKPRSKLLAISKFFMSYIQVFMDRMINQWNSLP